MQACSLFKGISLDLINWELAVLIYLVGCLFLPGIVDLPTCFDLLEARFSEGFHTSSLYAYRVSRLYELPHLMKVLVQVCLHLLH